MILHNDRGSLRIVGSPEWRLLLEIGLHKCDGDLLCMGICLVEPWLAFSETHHDRVGRPDFDEALHECFDELTNTTSDPTSGYGALFISQIELNGYEQRFRRAH